MDAPAATEKKPWAVWAMTKDTISGYIEDNCLSRGASIAYFTVFSLAPILLVMIAIAGFVFGEDAAGVLDRHGPAAEWHHLAAKPDMRGVQRGLFERGGSGGGFLGGGEESRGGEGEGEEGSSAFHSV